MSTTPSRRHPVLGIGSSSSTGDWVQVSRLGNPLVNEVVVPAGLKGTFNSISPARDADIDTLVNRVTVPEVPQLIQAIYGLPAPATPRNDLAEIFLTGITTKAGDPIKADLNSQLNNADVDPDVFRPSEMLRLNTSVPVSASPNRPACSPVTCRASRTAVVSPMTCSTSNCRRWRARRRPASWSTRWPRATR